MSEPNTLECLDCASPIGIGCPYGPETSVRCSVCGAEFDLFGDASYGAGSSSPSYEFYLERVRRPDAEEG